MLCRFLSALQQNRAQSRLLNLFHDKLFNNFPTHSLTKLYFLKPWANDHNMPTQHIATLLHAFGPRIGMCCNMLGVVGSNLTIVKPWPNDRSISTQHIVTLLGATCCVRLISVWPPCCDLLQHVGCCWLKFENGQSFHATFVDVTCVLV